MKLTPKKFLNFGEVLIFMLLIGAIFLINHFAPLYTDDYLYSFQYNQGFTFQDPAQLTYVPIHNVSDYFHSLKTLYLHLTGRVVPHGLLQIILMFPPYIFDIINTLALFLLCYLMAYWVAYKDKQKMLLYTLLAFSLFYIAVSRTETNFYLAAFSCNYIWTQIIVLIFLLPFRYHIEDNNYRSKSWVFAILMLILGLVAGDTNEPLIPGVLMFVFLYGGYCLVTRKRVPLWMWTSFAGLLTGYAFLYYAPGNTQRLLYQDEYAPDTGNMMFHLDNFKKVIYLSVSSFPALVLMILALFRVKKPPVFKDWIPFLAVVCIVTGTLFAFMFLPVIARRLNILFVSFYIIAALYFVYHSKLNKSLLIALIFFFLSPLLIFKLAGDYKVMYNANLEYHITDQEIAQAGTDSVLVTPRGYLDPITRGNWAKPIATYYGIRYLWVKDIMSSTYLLKSLPVKSGKTIILTQAANFHHQSIVPQIRYYDHNQFARTYYLDYPMDISSYNLNKIKGAYYSLSIKNPFLRKLYDSLPLRVRLYLMILPHGSRDIEKQILKKSTRFAFTIWNEGGKIDYIRICIQYGNVKISDVLFEDVRFDK